MSCLLTLTSYLVPVIPINGGAKRDRTADLLRARQALSQLSYSPIRELLKNVCLGSRRWS